MREVSDDIFSAVMEDMRRAAEAEILPRFPGVTAEGIRTKTAPDDLVTDADIGAERRLTEALSAHFPEALLVGEEAVSADPSILTRLGDADLAVIIDPVDGTWNFAHGVPLFGMIVAIVSGGETVAGLIHYPLPPGWGRAHGTSPAMARGPGSASRRQGRSGKCTASCRCICSPPRSSRSTLGACCTLPAPPHGAARPMNTGRWHQAL